MPRKLYDPKTKAAFLNAARKARRAGKTWAQAHADAKAAGYQGNAISLYQMLRAKSKKAGKKAGKRRGRKPGPKGKVGRPKGVGSIEAMIDRLVRERVNAVLDKAIAVLVKAKA